jgi:hypothetical protein
MRNPLPANNMPYPSLVIRRLFQFPFAAWILLLAACPTPLRAQSGTGRAAVEFCCVIWEPLPFTEVFYQDGESYLPLEFSPGERSKLYPMKKGGALKLYKKKAGADGALRYILLGKAPLVPKTRRMLFVIAPVPGTTGLPLRLYGVDDSLDAFPPGTSRFFNFSTAALQVRFGGKTSKLPAGEVTVVKSDVAKSGGFIPFLIGDLKGEVVFETRLFSQPTGRDMVFIGAPATPGGRVLVKLLPQLVSPEPPKPAGQPRTPSP